MKNLDYREYYRRNLPHFQPRGATFLVNFRLAGSLPAAVIEQLKAETLKLEQRLLKISNNNERLKLCDLEHRKLFDKWDDALHSTKHGRFTCKKIL